MLKVIFYIKAEKYLNGENPIFSKISYNNKSITLSTGKSISKERWQSTNKLRNVLKIEKEKVLKQSLDLYQLRIEKKFLELYKTDLNVSLIDLKKQIKGKPKLNIKSAGILEIFDKYNLSFKKRVAIGERAPASLQKYNRSKDLVKEFIKNKYNLNDYPVNEINGAFIYNLESFLKYDSKYKYKKCIKNNSVVKYFKNFKTVCNYGIKLELIKTLLTYMMEKSPLKMLYI
ncbi:hypothetical protein FUA48_14025 [Flavobacterium alkalisoli]|uniref:Uncharacterized protein n=1 Tax=Flavobacterium alkalisoli TaxID=2602769 RepID=A0A5B9FUT4_9FLAO|nr:phage integrase SAM-like domain-containing protein [Flavobacterium alkalisoli]QEE50654.1 hypothetical protein FUA48_14025 [Flavobacterium alkalisoli]